MFKYISLPNKTFEFQSSSLCDTQEKLKACLQPLHHGLMADARSFQQCAVQVCNPFYNSISHFLALQTSMYNERVKTHMGKLLLTHAVEVSLVTGDDQGPFYKGPEPNNKWILLIGDGLSLQNFWNFTNSCKTSKELCDALYQSLVICKYCFMCWTHCIVCSMEVLCSHSSHSSQTALGWKCIHSLDVAKLFQQCWNLLYIILHHCECLLWDWFLTNCPLQWGYCHHAGWFDQWCVQWGPSQARLLMTLLLNRCSHLTKWWYAWWILFEWPMSFGFCKRQLAVVMA